MIAADTGLDAILGADVEAIIGVLKGYQAVREKIGWDEYAAAKLKTDVRDMLTRVFSDARRQGYIRPRVVDGDLVFDRIVMHREDRKTKPADLCTLCNKGCQTRDDIDSGKGKWLRLHVPGYAEPKKCWEK